eukprot:gene17326-biopygen15889
MEHRIERTRELSRDVMLSLPLVYGDGAFLWEQCAPCRVAAGTPGPAILQTGLKSPSEYRKNLHVRRQKRHLRRRRRRREIFPGAEGAENPGLRVEKKNTLFKRKEQVQIKSWEFKNNIPPLPGPGLHRRRPPPPPSLPSWPVAAPPGEARKGRRCPTLLSAQHPMPDAAARPLRVPVLRVSTARRVSSTAPRSHIPNEMLEEAEHGQLFQRASRAHCKAMLCIRPVGTSCNNSAPPQGTRPVQLHPGNTALCSIAFAHAFQENGAWYSVVLGMVRLMVRLWHGGVCTLSISLSSCRMQARRLTFMADRRRPHNPSRRQMCGPVLLAEFEETDASSAVSPTAGIPHRGSQLHTHHRAPDTAGEGPPSLAGENGSGRAPDARRKKMPFLKSVWRMVWRTPRDSRVIGCFGCLVFFGKFIAPPQQGMHAVQAKAEIYHMRHKHWQIARQVLPRT